MKEGTGTASLVVSEAHTAPVVGSGDVPVLATPWLLAVCEQATVRAAARLLGPNETTVGTEIHLEHLGPSAIGTSVLATATVTAQDDRSIGFDVVAHDGDRVVGRGSIRRVRVDRDRFMAGR